MGQKENICSLAQMPLPLFILIILHKVKTPQVTEREQFLALPFLDIENKQKVTSIHETLPLAM